MGQITCSVEGCDSPAKSRAFCNTHYQRWYKTGDPLGSTKRVHRKARECVVERCSKPVSCRDYCARHYMRWLRHGDPLVSRDLRGDERPSVCAIADCSKPVEKIRWCGMHYQRKSRYGSFDDPRESEHERFWRQVDKNGPVAKLKPELGQCWVWTGTLTNGYGRFSVRWQESAVAAHRLAYEWEVGPIPRGLHMDHFACENPPCIRPTHVRPATVRENLLRGVTTIASTNLAKTHCPSGHPYAGDNLYLIPNGGGRACRTCNRDSDRRLYQLKRSASPQC